MIEAKGLLTQSEGDVLARLAADVPEWASVVEIGSYMGRSTCFLASDAVAPVYAIDLWDMKLGEASDKPRNKNALKVRFDSKTAFKKFVGNVKAAGLRDRITWIKGDSKEVAKAWSRPIGLLFIDGAHDTKSVTADYDGWHKHILENGWIAFHDADKEDSKVRRVIEEHVKPSGMWGEWQLTDRLMIGRRIA